MLEEFAERNGFKPYLSISDDGYTGTNFERPGWAEIMRMVDAGEVSAILLKTMDRMGRDYLRVGLYREMFHEKGIRIISVTEGFDSANGYDDLSPFREIMAEFYARDTSRKVKSAVKTKGREGKHLSGVPPYGYLRDPNDKERWIIDETAAEVVRRIYRMTIDGNGPFEIARILHDEGVERPAYHYAKMGLYNRVKSRDWDNSCAWVGSTVATIISRPEYLGSTVSFRTSKVSFKSKKKRILDKSEWLIFENTHRAIIDQETWDLAQKLRKTVRRTDTSGESNPLTGLLFCADCKAKMYSHRGYTRTCVNKKTGEEYTRTSYDFYGCSTHRSNTRKFISGVCSEHHVNTMVVREIILDILKRTSGYVREHEQEFIERVRGSSVRKGNEALKTHKSRMEKNDRRIAELDRLFNSLYEDKVKDVLSEERFINISSGFEREQAELKAENTALQAELADFESNKDSADKFISLVRRYTNFEELTNAMINDADVKHGLNKNLIFYETHNQMSISGLSNRANCQTQNGGDNFYRRRSF